MATLTEINAVEIKIKYLKKKYKSQNSTRYFLIVPLAAPVRKTDSSSFFMVRVRRNVTFTMATIWKIKWNLEKGGISQPNWMTHSSVKSQAKIYKSCHTITICFKLKDLDISNISKTGRQSVLEKILPGQKRRTL